MSYIASDKIEVFPVAKKRSETAPGTRIFTEKNVSNLSRQLLSNNNSGYIISCNSNEDDSTAFDMSFNLYGYYFNIIGIKPNNIDGTGSSIYASITIDIDETNRGQDELSGQDVNGYYEGLSLTKKDSKPENSDTVKYIKLLDNVNDTWKCSSQNFGLISALMIGGIDGKPK